MEDFNPKVTIVILTLGMPVKVIDCLNKQTYKNFEIIYAKEKGIVNAMNYALRRAKGEIFVRIDDDVSMTENWLYELIQPFRDKKVAGSTGPTFVPEAIRKNRDSIKYAENPNFFLRWMFDNAPYAPAKIYKCGSVSYGSNFIEKIEEKEYKIDHLEGTNWAMRTELIKKVGGFDPIFDGVAEWYDTDVEFKIKKLGYTLVYNPKAYLYHLLEKGAHYKERFDGMGRIKNFIRFHRRHSKFHPKMALWIILMWGYFVCRKFL